MATNGTRSILLMRLARWACLPFALLGGYVCFRWARELYGDRAGLLSLGIWCTSPDVLGHGSLITPDVAAASFGVLASYIFWTWLRGPCWARTVAVGLTLGMALLTKLTWVILIALWPILTAFWVFSGPRGDCSRSRRLGQLLVALAIAIYLVNAGYGFETTGRRLGNFVFVSDLLRSGGGNRFVGTWMGQCPVPLPANYVLGLDTQRRDFERIHWPSYLRGEFKERGWWYYYLYAALVKTPIGIQFLLLMSILTRCFDRRRWREESILLAPAIAVFILVSSQTGFSYHFRYVLPSLPFAFIWCGRTVSANRGHLAAACAWAGFAAAAISSLSVYPHSLSYFNEMAGGPQGGANHLLNSNIDWGQDLFYLKKWIDMHPQARPLRLAYFGRCDPAIFGLDYTLPLTREELASGGSDRRTLPPGHYAVSVNFLWGHPYMTRDGRGKLIYVYANDFSYLRAFQPIGRAGYSIYIYDVKKQKNFDEMAPLGLAPRRRPY